MSKKSKVNKKSVSKNKRDNVKNKASNLKKDIYGNDMSIPELPRVRDFIRPIKSEFDNRDILQVIIGASILAVPVGFTEETWNLGENLPLLNTMILLFAALVFISIFAYSHYHKGKMKTNAGYQLKHFSKRVFFTYLFSFLIVAALLTVIQVAPWSTDPMLALKRTIIVTFPSSMSAAVADILK